jgi:sorbitol-specific phosphotransferase system component IIA
MSKEIYCTNAISSFNVTKNELVMSLSYVPYQKAFQDTWWGGEKMILINPCWIETKDAYNNQGLNTPKKLDFIKNGIKEEGVVFDIEKVSIVFKEAAMDRMEKYGYSFENSDFHKWFEKEFNDHYYYETVTGALGDVYQINIFEKGHIEININEDYKSNLRFSKFIADDFEVGKVLKKVGQAIVEYPFFTVTEDGYLNFLKLNDNADMLLII